MRETTDPVLMQGEAYALDLIASFVRFADITFFSSGLALIITQEIALLIFVSQIRSIHGNSALLKQIRTILRMCNTAPIGIFDSGVGGLSVMHQIRIELPGEHLVYIADTAHAPYGDKSESDIARRALTLSAFLAGIGAKALVVACNTATAAAISQLRSRFSLPIIGMEPALKPAVAYTTTGVVGILATSGTLSSNKFDSLNAQYGNDIEVIAQACPGLVEQVESGDIDGDTTRALVTAYVSKLIQRGADTIVLGCTHYLALKAHIQQIAGPNIKIIDTSEAVAKQLARRLADNGLLNDKSRQGSMEVWSSNASEQTHRTIAKLLQMEIAVKSLPSECCCLETEPGCISK